MLLDPVLDRLQLISDDRQPNLALTSIDQILH